MNHFLVIELFLTANKGQVVKAKKKVIATLQNVESKRADLNKHRMVCFNLFVPRRMLVKCLLEFMTGTQRHGMI